MAQKAILIQQHSMVTNPPPIDISELTQALNDEWTFVNAPPRGKLLLWKRKFDHVRWNSGDLGKETNETALT
jgi:hypothetical protein